MDYDTITNILEGYLEDRTNAYSNLFNIGGKVSQEDIDYYVHYYLTPFIENEKYHPAIYRIQHFLGREYELFNHPDIANIVYELQDIFSINKEQVDNIENFEDFEFENINRIYDLWEELYNLVESYPLLSLEDYDYAIKDFIPIYTNPNTDTFVTNEFNKFVEIMKKEFPSSLRRIDCFIFCDPEYIEFVAGEGTMAYFTSESVFMPCYVSEENKKFFIETLFHETFHFIFSLLPETLQALWYELYSDWERDSVKMTREKKEDNEVEELFADVGSWVYSPVNDFIKQPSTIIIDSFKEILELGFRK